MYQTDLTETEWQYLTKVLFLEKLRGHVRVERNQNMEPGVGIIDSQSVKWGNNQSLNGVDGNKKVKGIKNGILLLTRMAFLFLIANMLFC